jgi:Ca2+-binding RTX toxin-like protein
MEAEGLLRGPPRRGRERAMGDPCPPRSHFGVWRAAIGATVLALLVLAPPALAAEGCTINGTSGSDFLEGTPRGDVICGGGSFDFIDGNGGNDVIRGGSGGDSLSGGPGNDVIRGGSGSAQFLDGDAGNDVLLGGDGRDYLDGDNYEGEGTGADVLSGGAGPDDLEGRGGRDVLRGGAGADYADGGEGRDVVRGDAGADELHGGSVVIGPGPPDCPRCGPDLGPDPAADILNGGFGFDDCTFGPRDVATGCERHTRQGTQSDFF